MANDKLYNYYTELPSWAKGVVVVGGLGMIYIIGSKIYAALKPKPQDVVNVQNDIVKLATKMQPSYGDASYDQYANTIYNAQRTSMDLPIAQQIIKAVQSTTADQVVLMPSVGGSLPLFVFERELKAKTITVPVANHDNNQHAENENIRLKNLWNGIETFAAIMLMK